MNMQSTLSSFTQTNVALKTILIGENAASLTLIDNALCKTPYAIEHQAESLAKVAAAEVLEKPSLIIIASNQLDNDLMTLLATLLNQQPMPVIIFTDQYDALLQQQAIQAGISAYVVDGLQKHRVLPLVSMAHTRFQHQQKMQQQVEDLQTKLADRKVIDRAKGLLMQQRQCSEDEAYKLLRTTAMNKNMRLAMLAQHVLSSANLLETPRIG